MFDATNANSESDLLFLNAKWPLYIKLVSMYDMPERFGRVTLIRLFPVLMNLTAISGHVGYSTALYIQITRGLSTSCLVLDQQGVCRKRQVMVDTLIVNRC